MKKFKELFSKNSNTSNRFNSHHSQFIRTLSNMYHANQMEDYIDFLENCIDCQRDELIELDQINKDIAQDLISIACYLNNSRLEYWNKCECPFTKSEEERMLFEVLFETQKKVDNLLINIGAATIAKKGGE